MTDKQKTCCFTGHRPGKLSFGYDETHPDCLRLKVALIGAVDRMRDRGVTTFYSGMAQGVDMMAAEIVLDIKRAYLDSRMRLVAVLPYEGQANRWTEKYRERYFTILSKADEVITLQKRYTDTCLLERNRYMVDKVRLSHRGLQRGGRRHRLHRGLREEAGAGRYPHQPRRPARRADYFFHPASAPVGRIRAQRKALTCKSGLERVDKAATLYRGHPLPL